jgi:outer membrane protein assembly factor BamB
MSSSPTEPVGKPSALRTWFPLLALALAAVAVTLVWIVPGEDTARLYQVLGTYIAGGVTFLALLLWLLFWAPYPRSTRYGVLAVCVALMGLLVVLFDLDDRGFYGNLVPRFQFRFGASRDDALDQHRKQIAGEQIQGARDLSGTLADDFPEYRGRRRDGVVEGPALARDWTAQPPRQLWRQPVGAGHSSFAIAGPLAVTLEQRRDQEAIVAYEVASGRQVWIHTYPARFKELLGGIGPRSTPTVAGGEVYSLGATGKLVCLEASSGKHRWTVDVLEDNENIKWGMSGSPLVFEDVVVVNPGTQTEKAPGVLAAYDRKTGTRRWAAGRAHAGYSSPQRATLSGKPQVLLFDGEGIAGYDPSADGKPLWRHPWATQENINASQPLVAGDDRVFLTSGYTVGCALLEVKESGGVWSVSEVWKNRKLRARFSSPVLHAGHVYGLDEGVLTCLDVQTGERKWRGERYGHGQMLLSGGLLVILGEEGELALVEATPAGYRELGRTVALEGRTWNVPALSGGLLLVRNGTEMACYDLRPRNP